MTGPVMSPPSGRIHAPPSETHLTPVTTPPATPALAAQVSRRAQVIRVLVVAAVWALPLLRPAGPGNTGPVDVVVAVAVLVAALWISGRGHGIRVPYGFTVALSVIAGAFAATAAYSGAYGGVGGGLLALLQDVFLLLWAAAVANIGRDPALLRTLTRAWAISATFWACVLIVGVLGHISALSGETLRTGARASLTLGDPNLAANYFLCSLLVLRAVRYPMNRGLRWACCALIITAMAFTGSNGGALALVLATALGCIFGLARRRGAAVAVLAASAMVLAATVGVSSLHIQTIVQKAQAGVPILRDSIGRQAESSGSRSTILSQTKKLYFTGDTPVGLGPGGTKVALKAGQYAYVKEAHDDYAAAVVERGVLGGVALVLLVFIVLTRCRRIAMRPLRRSYADIIARPELLGVAAIAMFLSALIYEVLHFRHIWALFGLIAALDLWGRQDRDADRPDPPGVPRLGRRRRRLAPRLRSRAHGRGIGSSPTAPATMATMTLRSPTALLAPPPTAPLARAAPASAPAPPIEPTPARPHAPAPAPAAQPAPPRAAAPAPPTAPAPAQDPALPQKAPAPKPAPAPAALRTTKDTLSARVPPATAGWISQSPEAARAAWAARAASSARAAAAQGNAAGRGAAVRRGLRLSAIVPSVLTANVAARIVALASLAVATVLVARAGGPKLLGELTLLRVLPGLAGVLVCCGLPTAVPYFLAGRDRYGAPRLRTTLVGLTLVGSLAASACWLALSPVLHHVFFTLWGMGVVIAASVPVFTQLWVAVGKSFLQGENDMRGANWAIAAEEAAFLPVYLALTPLMHGTALLMSALVAADVLVVAGIVLRLAWKGFLRGWGKPHLGLAVSVSRYGLRGQVGGMLTLVNLRLDVAILGALAGPGVLGVYAVASKFAELLRLPGLAVTYVLYPRLSTCEPVEAGRRAARLMPRAFGLTVLAAVPLAAAVPLLPLIYGPAFVTAVIPACILLVGLIGEGVAGVVSAYLYGVGRPGTNSLGVGVAVVVTVVLDLLLIPRYHVMGAATASAVAYLTSSAALLACYFAVRKAFLHARERREEKAEVAP